jgi:hypothetical protein
MARFLLATVVTVWAQLFVHQAFAQTQVHASKGREEGREAAVSFVTTPRVASNQARPTAADGMRIATNDEPAPCVRYHTCLACIPSVDAGKCSNCHDGGGDRDGCYYLADTPEHCGDCDPGYISGGGGGGTVRPQNRDDGSGPYDEDGFCSAEYSYCY